MAHVQGNAPTRAPTAGSPTPSSVPAVVSSSVSPSQPSTLSSSSTVQSTTITSFGLSGGVQITVRSPTSNSTGGTSVTHTGFQPSTASVDGASMRQQDQQQQHLTRSQIPPSAYVTNNASSGWDGRGGVPPPAVPPSNHQQQPETSVTSPVFGDSLTGQFRAPPASSPTSSFAAVPAPLAAPSSSLSGSWSAPQNVSMAAGHATSSQSSSAAQSSPAIPESSRSALESKGALTASSVPAAVAPATPAVPITSVPTSFFINTIPIDYVCTICKHVPLRPITPSCCGTVCCTPCLTKSLGERSAAGINDCQFCDTVAHPPIPSPYLSLKIGAETVHCIHYRGHLPAAASSSLETKVDAGCPWQSMLGKEGKRLTDHLSGECEYTPVTCPGCGQRVARRSLASHRGTIINADDCQHKPAMCPFCDLLVHPNEQKAHDESPKHQLMVNKRDLSLVARVAALERELKEMTRIMQHTASELDIAKTAIVNTQTQYEAKLTASAQRFEHKMSEMQSAATTKFVEIDINNFSAIHVKSMAECTALYSAATPLREWGHEWWLKVEKSLDGRVGLYLCCGSDESISAPVANTVAANGAPNPVTANTIQTTRWPISCDYQLMARRRNTDDAVCCSVVFRTEFGRERAWGLSRFATLEALEREGAYNRTEDKLTFGCVIFPGRNLRWGQLPIIRRAPTTTASNAPAAAQ